LLRLDDAPFKKLDEVLLGAVPTELLWFDVCFGPKVVRKSGLLFSCPDTSLAALELILLKLRLFYAV
jgi:hypothetical protein